MMSYADAGLESFLHLLEPNHQQPKIVVDEMAIYYRLGVEESRKHTIRIVNTGRGCLFGTISFLHKIDGLSLSENKFEINSKFKREIVFTLSIDMSQIAPGERYQTSIVISSNASKGDLVIPVTIEAYRYPLASSTALWLITIPLSIFMGFLLHFNIIQYLISDLFGTDMLGTVAPFIIYGSGYLGLIIYNVVWSNSAKGRDNNLANYILSIFCFLGFIVIGFLLVFLIVMAAIIFVIIVLLMFLGSSKK